MLKNKTFKDQFNIEFVMDLKFGVIFDKNDIYSFRNLKEAENFMKKLDELSQYADFSNKRHKYTLEYKNYLNNTKETHTIYDKDSLLIDNDYYVYEINIDNKIFDAYKLKKDERYLVIVDEFEDPRQYY